MAAEEESSNHRAEQQHLQAVGARKVMGLEIRARRDELSATYRELVFRRVWPRRGRLWHGATVLKVHGAVHSTGKRQRTVALQNATASSAADSQSNAKDRQ